jgi:hypothetical protein
MPVSSKSGHRAVRTRPNLPIPVPVPSRAAYNFVMTDSRKPSFGFWVTILVASVPLVYVLSFSPACYLVDRGSLPACETARFYRPLIRGATYNFWPIAIPLRRYGELLLPSSHLTPTDSNVVDVMDMMLAVEVDVRAIRGLEADE